jgi:Secretion system C-terminal sorting domain
MTKILYVIPFLFLFSLDLKSQCIATNDDFTTYGAGGLAIGAPVSGTEVNINTAVWAGSFTIIDKIVAGSSYTANINQAAAGLQVYQGSTQIGSGSTSASFTAINNTPIRIYVCGNDMSSSRVLSMTGSGSLATVYDDYNSPGSMIIYPAAPYSSSNPNTPSFIANTTNATNPTATLWCGSGSPFNSRRDVWFSFTKTTASGPVTIRHDNIIPTERSNISISPTSLVGIAVYSGSSTTPLSCGLTTSGFAQITTGNLSSGSYRIRIFSNLGDADALNRNSFQTNFFVLDPNLILPVELVKFEATKKGNTNILTWQTASEKNNSHFDIERSTTGQDNWVKIGSVKGNGNSQIIRDYAFTDNGPLSISYYRLKQNDNDGNFDYSNVVNVVNKNGKFKINALMPNPTKDNLTIQFESNNNETVQIAVMDMTGRVVLTQNAQNTEGPNAVVLNLANLSNGMYMVSLKNCESVIVNKIVKN